MKQLIAALGDNIKPKGNNWIARCPVHNDSDFAMGIKQLNDGSIIANCFSCGANGLDLYRHLGLDLDELFGGRKLDKTSLPPQMQSIYDTDKLCVNIFESDQRAGRRSSLADKRRYRLATARIKGVEQKYAI